MADRYPYGTWNLLSTSIPLDVPWASTRVVPADVLQAAAVNRMAVSHWIEHQAPVGASRNSCTPHAHCRLGQVGAGHQVLTAADPQPDDLR